MKELLEMLYFWWIFMYTRVLEPLLQPKASLLMSVFEKKSTFFFFPPLQYGAESGFT